MKRRAFVSDSAAMICFLSHVYATSYLSLASIDLEWLIKVLVKWTDDARWLMLVHHSTTSYGIFTRKIEVL